VTGSKAPVLLALDTSADLAGVAVAQGQTILASAVTPATGQQAETLAPLIAATMKEAGVEFDELSAVVCAVGPGPYTGLRVGVMSAQIIGAASEVPVYGVSTHDLLAQQFHDRTGAPASSGVVVITQGRRREPAFSAYVGLERVEGPDIGEMAQIRERYPLAEIVSAVDLGPSVTPEVRWQQVSPNPAVLCEYFTRTVEGVAVAGGGLIEPAPIYLRPADAREPVDLRAKALKAALKGRRS